MKKLIYSLIACLVVILPVSVALAAPSNVTFTGANPQSTTMGLIWLTSNATTTIIRYRTDTYPSSPADGTLAYNGTGYQTTVGNLTAGTVYYFTAWGWDGSSYSPSPVPSYSQIAMSTLSVDLPTGGNTPPTNVHPVPTVPAGATANASTGGFNLEPFTSIIAYFDTAPFGGLGMPINNAWETLATLVITFCGLWVYKNNKNFFTAYFVVLILTCFAVGMHLTQWYLVPIELCVGVGVWALERFFQ